MPEPGRSTLADLLLRDTISTVGEADLLDAAYVVTSSKRMLQAALAMGAKTLEERKDSGVNAAVELAVAVLKAFDWFMVVPTDLPLLTRGDLRTAIELKDRGMEMVIAPSAAFNGTNLLLFSRAKAPKLSYDHDSFWNHVSSAGEEGLRTAVVATEGLLSDLDTPEDLESVRRAGINRRSLLFLKGA